MAEHHYDQFYIGGQWVSPVVKGALIDVVDPSTEKLVAQLPEGSEHDVNAAVRSALQLLCGIVDVVDLLVRLELLTQLHPARLLEYAGCIGKRAVNGAVNGAVN